ncbi:MAG: hypothetical protein ACRC1H_09955 [Caldilineaceae bacterium]
MATTSLADHINDSQYDAATITHACVNLVQSDSGLVGAQGIYAALVQNARDAAGVDQMLYQLSGDPAYAEQAALIVLSAAWNNPEAVEPIKQMLAAAAEAHAPMSDSDLAATVLYGMYRIARGGAPLSEVTFRNAAGRIESTVLSETMPAAALFDALRDQY